MTKEIPISELKPGMFVLSVTKQKKSFKVKSQGFINSQSAIDKLAASGISAVVVDPSKEMKSEEDAVSSESEQTVEETAPVDTGPKVPLDSEMGKASNLYKEAKTLQGKLLDSIKEDKQLDIDAVKGTTEAIVDSIYRNQDALSCIARLRDKDAYLVEHSLNVSILMSIFAKHMGFEEQVVNELALGAFLHDLGKVKIPDEILHKKGRFTDEEYEIMKGHVNFGVEAIMETPGIPPIALEVVKQHHERLDGAGYPNKLPAEDITQYGRMIAIVDSYDAMTAERVYKAGMHPIKAFKILSKEAPNAYDKELVEKFIQCLGIYPVGTLVKLTSGKLGIISRLNAGKPLNPFVRVFYNTRMNQTIPIEDLDLSRRRYDDQIDCCIKPEEFNINLLQFFKAAFIE